MLRNKLNVFDQTLEALKEADLTRSLSVGIFLNGKRLKMGMSWLIFRACIEFLKDNTPKSIRHIRLAFDNAEIAGVLKRRMMKNKKELRNSIL